jgi:hypothetical protein
LHLRAVAASRISDLRVVSSTTVYTALRWGTGWDD